MKQIFGQLIILFTLAGFVGVRGVFAAPTNYIDPNTGGMIFQFLAVAFALLSGLIFFFSSRIKMALARLTRFFREKFNKDADAKGSVN